VIVQYGKLYLPYWTINIMCSRTSGLHG